MRVLIVLTLLINRIYNIATSIDYTESFVKKCKMERKKEGGSSTDGADLQKLEIFTVNEQSFEDVEIEILRNCKVSGSWSLEKSSSFFEKVDNIYEKDSIVRRSFRIRYRESQAEVRNPIVIDKIKIYEEERESPGSSVITSVNFPYSLEQGNSFDFYIDYKCNTGWSKITIQVYLENSVIEFGYIKICSVGSKIITNPTYFLLILLFIFISYLCEKDYLIFNVHIIKINPEEIIALKYAEYITIYTLILLSILILLGILTLFKEFSYASGFIISLISVKFVVKSTVALFNPKFDEKVSNQTWLISEKYDIIISLSKIIYYTVAAIILVFWLIYSNNFFLMNLIAFSISYLVIKKFLFKNFYFILFLYLSVTVYNIIWMNFNTTKYNGTFNYTNGRVINIPISFVLPELIKNPYGTRYFFSILDLILVGFLLEYLKRTKLDSNYLKYGQQGFNAGLLLNLISFYLFKFYFPFFVLPGNCTIITVIIFSLWRGEFIIFSHLDVQEKHLRNKIVKEYPLTIIGADQSHDFNEMITIGKYVPPYIINEMEDNIEESPKDQDFLKHEVGEVNDNNKEKDEKHDKSDCFDKKSEKYN